MCCRRALPIVGVWQCLARCQDERHCHTVRGCAMIVHVGDHLYLSQDRRVQRVSVLEGAPVLAAVVVVQKGCISSGEDAYTDFGWSVARSEKSPSRRSATDSSPLIVFIRPFCSPSSRRQPTLYRSSVFPSKPRTSQPWRTHTPLGKGRVAPNLDKDP